MSKPKNKNQHFAHIALIGAPNAGKSTLTNALLETKLAIVSPKPQTTRRALIGLLTEGDTQLALIDTPGIFDGEKPGNLSKLNKHILSAAWEGLASADSALLIVDAKRGLDEEHLFLLNRLKQATVPIALVLNKVDLMNPEGLLPLTVEYTNHYHFDRVFMISALKKNGVDDIKNYMKEKAPVAPWQFEEDQLSNASERFLAAEITREQCFILCHQEIPYHLAVETEAWEEYKDGSVKITQRILVTRESQKKIVIGLQGSQLKRIGAKARKEIGALLGRNVHLFLFVAVEPKWEDHYGGDHLA